MSGGLMQLVAIGQQDAYLTENPTITFWKRAYQRHTNFAVESIEQTFVGQVNYGNTASVNISRNGDLLNKAYIWVKLPKLTGITDNNGVTTNPMYVKNVGHALIESVTMSIGGQKIDRHTGEWMQIWNQLAAKNLDGLNAMIGEHETGEEQILYIPLHFWWNRTPGMALPLIALQYHEVKIEVRFAKLESVVVDVAAVSGSTNFEAKLIVDYVYIDNEERKRFAQANHEYLIDQVQQTSEALSGTYEKKISLNFNHPVKELVWVVKSNFDDDRKSRNQFDFGLKKNTASARDVSLQLRKDMDGIVDDSAENEIDLSEIEIVRDPFAGSGTVSHGSNDTIQYAKISLNGHDRFTQRDAKYFNLVQPYQHHSNMPGDGIYCYSFALEPESEQPSGSCNFSRIDRAELVIQPVTGNTDVDGAQVTVYAVNFNVLRLMGGMGGVAYAN